ncbi:hypothetical protein ACX80E_09110 [Arthrobacter sp. TMN-49]
MTKLIAALAILAALACATTATASWIAKKKAPLAIGLGRAQIQATPAELDKAMKKAQWRMVAAIAFAAVMFATLFRVSIGLSGQEGLPLAATAGLSASGGLLLFSALPAAKLPSDNARPPLLPKLAFILPAAILAAFTAFVIVAGLVPAFTSMKNDGVPLLLMVVALGGSALLVLHRLTTTRALTDPRMSAADRRWRELSARNLLNFTNGALLAYFGTAVILAALAWGAAGAETASPNWVVAGTAGGAALALAGVVLLALAAKGSLTIRTRAREGTGAPITA